MTAKEFNKIVHEQIERCEQTLCSKSEEYATEDKLHNFKQAARVQKCTLEKALAGMMCKHTISIYDMINGVENGKTYPIEQWNEKIGDHINYLLILAAVIREGGEKTAEKEKIYETQNKKLSRFEKELELTGSKEMER